MASGSVQGITIEFNSDVTGVSRGIKSIESESTSLQKQITQINKSLKFDSGNIELISQKMDLMAQSAVQCGQDVEGLQQLQAQMDAAKIDKSAASYRKLEQEIAIAQSKQKSFQEQYERSLKTAPIEALNRQYDLLKEDIQASDKELQKLEQEMAKLEASGVDKTSDQYVKLQQKIETARSKNEKLRGELKQLESIKAAREQGENFEDLGDNIDDAADSADKAGAGFQSMQEGLQGLNQILVSAGLLSAVKELAGAFEECIQTSMTFEATMSKVSALSGATGDDLTALSDKAKELGASTKFTAAEAAEGFSYMALAGWDTADMLEGIQPILSLAAASEMELGEASDIVTDYLTAFGLSAQDAGHFADQMAYAMSSSNTTTAQLGDAYKNCAAAASSLGFSVEDVTAGIMVMSNAGVKGGEAGTALNAIMTRLATDTKECASSLKDYGVNVRDEAGNMRSMSDILGDMSKLWGTLSGEEQAALSKAVAGQSHYAALQTVLNGCAESAEGGVSAFEQYAAALDNCDGVADGMSETMEDNLQGSMTKLNSATDGLKNTIGEGLAPALRNIVDDGTGVVTKINELMQSHKELIPILTGAAAALGTTAVAISGLTIAGTVATMVSTLGISMSAALGPIGLAAAAIGVLVAAIASSEPAAEGAAVAINDLQNAIDSQAFDHSQTVESLQAEGEASLSLVNTLDQLVGAYDGSASSAAEINAVIDQLNSAVPGLSLAFDENTGALSQNADAIEQLIEKQMVYDQLSEAIANRNTTKQQFEDAQKAAEDAQVAFDDANKALNDYIQNNGGAYDYGLDAVASNAAANLDAATKAANDASDAYNAAQAEVDGLKAAYDGFAPDVENANDALTETAEAAEEVDEAAQKAHDAILEVGMACIDARGTGDELMAQYKELASTFEKNADNCDRATRAYVENQLQTLRLHAMSAQLCEQLPLLGKGYEGLATAIDQSGYSVDEFVKSYQSTLSSLTSGFGELTYETEKGLSDWVSAMDQRTQLQNTWNDNMTTLVDAATNAATHPFLSAMPEYQQAVQTMMDGGMETYGTAAAELAQAVSDRNKTTISEVCNGIIAAGSAAEEAAKNQFALSTGLTLDTINELMDAEAVAVENGQVVIKDAAAAAAAGVPEGIEEATSDAESAASTVISGVADAILSGDVETACNNGGKALVEYMISGISEKQGDLASGMMTTITAAVTRAKNTARAQGRSTGYYFDSGFAEGIYNSSSLVYSAAYKVASDAAAAAKKAVKIESPSKVMMEVGGYFSEGFAIGIQNGATLADKAAAAMASGAAASASTASASSVTNNTSYGGSTFEININGASGDANQIADAVMNKINQNLMRQRGARR